MFALQTASRRWLSTVGKDKVVVTAALNGVLTDPAKFTIPVTPEEIGNAAKEAYDAGASVVHVHLRDLGSGMGHMPSWDPDVAEAVCDSIRDKAPEVLINLTTGTVGKSGAMGGGDLGPTGGPITCLERVRPEMAALNSGSLNYLKIKSDGSWAWPPMLFANPVEKVKTMLDAMKELGIAPECECFDTGIVRSIAMFEKNGLLQQPVNLSLVMGVASGMPANPDWLPLLVQEMSPETQWQVIAIGRPDNVWPLLRRASELGGNVRAGLEDGFYLPDGTRTASNGALIEALVKIVRETGREPTTPAEARVVVGARPK